MAYYRRSREPENIGQNIDVFRPLPSLHQQIRQRKQTGILPQFGFSDTGASSYHHQAPPRERLTAYVNVNGINATSSPEKRATSVSSDDDEETLPKRGRGRPRKNQNVPPYSYSRRSSDRDYNPGPTRNYYHQAYSRDNRSAERNFPARNGRRSADPAMKRSRSREPYNRDHSYADNQRGRSQGFEADVNPRRSTRSSERQPRRSTERFPNAERRSVEAIDSPQQQPSSSWTVQTAAPSLTQRRPIIRSLENKEPSIASMVLRLYNPSNHNFHFAPNIFAYPSIRENVNGLNTIGNIIDAAGKYKEQKRGKKFLFINLNFLYCFFYVLYICSFFCYFFTYFCHLFLYSFLLL